MRIRLLGIVAGLLAVDLDDGSFLWLAVFRV